MNIPNEVSSTSGLLGNHFEVGNASPNGKIFLPIQNKGMRLSDWKIPITPSPTGLVPDIHPGALSTPLEPFVFKPKMSNISELFIKEKDAFLKIKDELLGHETYRGKFVAIYEGKVVDFAENKKELAKRVYRRFGYIPIYIGKVEKEQVVGEMSSPERG
jgi:hypothetical protein